MGHGARFGLDIGRGTYWFPTENAVEDRGEDDPKGDILRRFSGWHDPISTVITATPGDAILCTDISYLPPLPRWSKGRVVLLGDAAHATTPGIGQGAAQAIEDAVVLSDQLAREDDLRTALTAYESIRRPRAEAVLRLSRNVDRAAQLASPLGCRLRNAAVRWTPTQLQERHLESILRDRG